MMTGNSEAPLSAMTERIMDSAESLLAQSGYHGFSYDDVAKQVGIKKPSIHHHFAKKAILVSAIVRRYTLRFQVYLKEIEERQRSVRDKLSAYALLFHRTYESERELCVCGMLGAESAALPTQVNHEVQNFFLMNLAWLTRVIAADQPSVASTTSQHAEDHAFLFLSALEGSMVVGRGLQCRRGPIDVAQVWLSMFH